MSVEHGGAMRERFVTAVVPWLIAAAGLLVYLGTLNHWVSLQSLPVVARTSGWTWQRELVQPLTLLVFYPFRFLPERWIPLALNVFAAACGALVLLLLARSVVLLPHDRTHEQRRKETSNCATLTLPAAWMPPVLAAVACGLQLTFWERATSGNGDLINLLIFAGVIWCLLEFRIVGDQSWLSTSAFLYAAGMANDWTLIGYLPGFLAAIVWSKGFSFFNIRFLLRMGLWGCAGLCLYLVLPVIYVSHPMHALDFWGALKTNLGIQREALASFPRDALPVLALTSMLPVLIISIRWRSQGPHSGDDSRMGNFVTRSMFHLAHLAFLAVSVWIALDPPVSPRNLGIPAPLLTQYYLSALVIGYCLGYFLLIGVAPIARAPHGQKAGWAEALVGKLTVSAAWLMLAALPLALVWRNFGQLRTTNGPALHEFARQLYRALPAGKSVVLSDDISQLYLVQAELAARRHDKDPLLLDTASLAWGQYQLAKASEFRSRWPLAPPTNGLTVVDAGELLQLVTAFARREPVVYLHPSYSRCFERFADQPSGPLHYLVARTGDDPNQPLDARMVGVNQRYWEQLWADHLETLARQADRSPGGVSQAAGRLADDLKLATEPNPTLAFLGHAYAKLLNDWGVRMQRLGHWQEAGLWFQRAVDLRPDDLAAQINLEFNHRCQQGDRQRLDREAIQKRFLDLFARHRKWEGAMSEDGPVDEPTFLLETARVLLGKGNSHQAIQAFARCAELAPDWLEAKLWLAQAQLAVREYRRVLDLTDGLAGSASPRDGSENAQLLFCRATALLGLGRTNEAAACIGSFVSQHPEQTDVLGVAAQLYLQSRQYQPALAVLARMVDQDPHNPELLSNKALAEMQLAQYDAAIATLTTALALTPSNQVVRLNRAIASLRAGQLEAADADYQQVLSFAPKSYKVLFGLGEIAWRRQDTNAARQYYERCLPLGDPASDEYQLVAERLQQLTGKPGAAGQ